MRVPFKYLGVLIYRKKEVWKDMITKIRKRFGLWKGKHLSFIGRVTHKIGNVHHSCILLLSI